MGYYRCIQGYIRGENSVSKERVREVVYEKMLDGVSVTASAMVGVGVMFIPEGSSLYDFRRIAINMGVFNEVYAVFSFRFFSRIAFWKGKCMSMRG